MENLYVSFTFSNGPFFWVFSDLFSLTYLQIKIKSGTQIQNSTTEIMSPFTKQQPCVSFPSASCLPQSFFFLQTRYFSIIFFALLSACPHLQKQVWNKVSSKQKNFWKMNDSLPNRTLKTHIGWENMPIGNHICIKRKSQWLEEHMYMS